MACRGLFSQSRTLVGGSRYILAMVNLIGFIVALLVGLVFAPAERERTGGVIWSRESLMAAGFDARWRLRYATLFGAALIFTLMLSAFGVR